MIYSYIKRTLTNKDNIMNILSFYEFLVFKWVAFCCPNITCVNLTKLSPSPLTWTQPVEMLGWAGLSTRSYFDLKKKKKRFLHLIYIYIYICVCVCICICMCIYLKVIWKVGLLVKRRLQSVFWTFLISNHAFY